MKKSDKNSKKSSKKSKKSNPKKNNTTKLIDLGIRYALLLIIAFIGVKLFYFIFAPITTYGSYWLLDLFFNASLKKSLIIVNNTFPIEIIGPCVAGSAYLLLTILNLSTPGIKPQKRVEALFFSFATLLLLNIFRIFFLGNLYIFSFESFDILHSFFWYFLSIFFVICIWFFIVRIYDIREIPFYTDIKYLYSLARSK